MPVIATVAIHGGQVKLSVNPETSVVENHSGARQVEPAGRESRGAGGKA